MGDPFALDRKTVVAVALIGLVLGPAMILGAIWKLTHGLDPTLTTGFEWFASASCAAVGLAIIRGIVRELSGAVGVRFDDAGVERGRVRMAWSEIRTIDSPEFGRLIVSDDSGRTLRITSYLFHDRALLLREIARRSGVETRERMRSR